MSSARRSDISSSTDFELVADLVEDREAVVEEVVEHLVEEAAGALREELLTERLVALAAREQARDRKELAVRDRDEVVRAEEDVELGRVEPLDRLVVRGEVEDDEEVAVLVVVIDLRPLPRRDDVLDVERVPAEALGELGCRLHVGRDDVDPGETASGELADGRLGPRDDLRARARAVPLQAGQAGHRY